MLKPTTTLLYLAHGPLYLHNQVIFSILTLLKYVKIENHLNNISIVIYTDNIQHFEKHLVGLPIKYEEISKEIIAGYIKNNYIHRAKICVIQDCIMKYNTNILFIDSDTYFLKSPIPLTEQITESQTVFFNFEYTVADGGDLHEGDSWLVLRKLAKKFEYNLNGEKFKIGFESEMWNSGVLGIHKKYYSLIEDVLNFNDQLTSKFYFKTAEQFAFTYVLSKYTTLISAEEFVYHYYPSKIKWLYNQQICKFLKDFRSEKLESKIEKAVNLTSNQDKFEPLELSFVDKVIDRLSLIWKVAKKGHL